MVVPISRGRRKRASLEGVFIQWAHLKIDLSSLKKVECLPMSELKIDNQQPQEGSDGVHPEKARDRIFAEGQKLSEEISALLRLVLQIEPGILTTLRRRYNKLFKNNYVPLASRYDSHCNNISSLLTSTRQWYGETQLPKWFDSLSEQKAGLRGELENVRDLLTHGDNTTTAFVSVGVAVASLIVSFAAYSLTQQQFDFNKKQDEEMKATVLKFDQRMQSQIGLTEKLNEGLGEQINVLKEQGVITKTQLEVFQRQVDLERLLRSQKPNLQVEVWLTPGQHIDSTSNDISLDFVIKNTGQKLAEQTFFNIWVPAELKIKSIKPPLGKIAEHVPAEVTGKSYAVIRGMQPGQIPVKGPGFRLGTIVVEFLPGDYVFLWKLSANGEEFPAGEKRGEYPIKLSRPQIDKKS